MEDVRTRGDAALRELTKKFDNVQLDRVCIPVQVSSCVPCAAAAAKLAALLLPGEH